MKRILIVEDVDMNRDLLAQILEDDYEILEAVDGQDGYEKALAEKPDLILMDMLMPRMSGDKATAELRKHPEMKDTPIIAVTAQAMSGDAETALNAGCNDYVTKPIDEDILVEKIRKYIGK